MTERDAITEEPEQPRPARTPLVRILIAVLAIAALVAAGAGGWLLRGSGGATVAENSIDAGFARDMAIHHIQATAMAAYARDNTDNPSLKLLAYDIETSQQFELGQMSGWLNTWGLSRQSKLPVMSWMPNHEMPMGSGMMPGMASPTEMNRLQSLRGEQMDILFLQLMIRHHQGALPMAQYTLERASTPYVRRLAKAMITVQSNEIVVMERLLRGLGGAPLPAPGD